MSSLVSLYGPSTTETVPPFRVMILPASYLSFSPPWSFPASASFLLHARYLPTSACISSGDMPPKRLGVSDSIKRYLATVLSFAVDDVGIGPRSLNHSRDLPARTAGSEALASRVC